MPSIDAKSQFTQFHKKGLYNSLKQPLANITQTKVNCVFIGDYFHQLINTFGTLESIYNSIIANGWICTWIDSF